MHSNSIKDIENGATYSAPPATVQQHDEAQQQQQPSEGYVDAEDAVRICCCRPNGRHAWWFGSTIAAMVFQTALVAGLAVLLPSLGVYTIIVVLPVLLTVVAGSVLVCCKRSSASCITNAVAQAVAVACNPFEIYSVVSALLLLFLFEAVSNHSSSNNDTPGPSRSDDGYSAARSLALGLLILYVVLASLAWVTSLVACIGSSLAAHDSRRAHKLSAEPTEPTTEYEPAELPEHSQELQQAETGATAQLA
eukprot:10423-Heterococcus_DN1.PRE.1